MKPLATTESSRRELILDAAKISWGVRLQKGADPAKAAKDAMDSGVLFADEAESYFGPVVFAYEVVSEKDPVKGQKRKG